MDEQNEVRSSLAGMTGARQGVGARHGKTLGQQGGGGYLDICTIFESSEKKSRDPRLAELREMGLSLQWRELAEQIGYDAFMIVWASLSEMASCADSGHRVYVPRFDSYMRFQRNRYILALAGSGAKPKEIKQRVSEDLNESVHEVHISRLTRQLSPR